MTYVVVAPVKAACAWFLTSSVGAPLAPVAAFVGAHAAAVTASAAATAGAAATAIIETAGTEKIAYTFDSPTMGVAAAGLKTVYVADGARQTVRGIVKDTSITKVVLGSGKFVAGLP